MNIFRLTTIAVREARKSTYGGNKHAAVIFKGNRVIARGHNYVNRYCSDYSDYCRWINSVHAEVDTILRAGESNCRGADILVIRINNRGDLRYSLPCSYCRALIDHVGIRAVYYSEDDGRIIRSFHGE